MVQYLLDAFALVSTPIYLVVLVVVVVKRPFSFNFTILTVSLGAADLIYGFAMRLITIFPNRDLFR